MARKTNFNVNGYNYYKVTKTIGHKENREPIKKVFYGSSKSEAEQKAIDYIQNLKLGLQFNDCITITDLFPKWLFEHKKHELKPSTFESYEGLYRNYIEPDDISTQPIKDLKSINIQNFYDRLMKLKLKHTEKPMTPDRVQAIHKLLHLFFVYCEKDGYTIKNPCNNVTLPKDNKKDLEILERKNKIDFLLDEFREKLLDFVNVSISFDVTIKNILAEIDVNNLFEIFNKKYSSLSNYLCLEPDVFCSQNFLTLIYQLGLLNFDF